MIMKFSLALNYLVLIWMSFQSLPSHVQASALPLHLSPDMPKGNENFNSKDEDVNEKISLMRALGKILDTDVRSKDKRAVQRRSSGRTQRKCLYCRYTLKYKTPGYPEIIENPKKKINTKKMKKQKWTY